MKAPLIFLAAFAAMASAIGGGFALPPQGESASADTEGSTSL